MQFNYNLKMNPTSKILKDHGLTRDGKVTKHLRDTIERFSIPFVPGGSAGKLAKLVTYPANDEIKYTSPYAKYQYYGKLMLAKNGSAWAKKGEKKILTDKNLRYHVSGTGAKWDKLMLRKRKADVVKDLENYINGGK